MEFNVYIAVSLDGYIARLDNGLDWLEHDTGGDDYGFSAFIERIDLLLMGANTYSMILSFGGWPYKVPVIVLSHFLKKSDVPEELQDRVTISAEDPQALAARLQNEGVKRVYLDGGKLITSFLQAGLVDEMILTRVPILLGRGIPLFGERDGDIGLNHVATKSFPSGLVQSTYRIKNQE